jgi:hypothetical protein
MIKLLLILWFSVSLAQVVWKLGFRLNRKASFRTHADGPFDLEIIGDEPAGQLAILIHSKIGLQKVMA